MGQADPRLALADRLFPEPAKPPSGEWYCVHADCEGRSGCEFGDMRLWRPR